MRRVLLLSLLFTAFVLTRCVSPAPEGEVEVVPNVLYVEPIGQGQNALLADTTERVFRDSLEWVAFQSSLRPTLPFKPVDFRQAMVVLIAVPTETSGQTIQIETVEEYEAELVVQYVLSAPGSDCAVAVASSVPFQAVLVRRAEGPARFERRNEPYPCTLG